MPAQPDDKRTDAPGALRLLSRAGIIVGLLLMAAAIAAYCVILPPDWRRSPTVLTPLITGFIIAFACLLANMRWLLSSLLRRATRAWIQVALAAAAALTIVILVNLISIRHFRRWDLTAARAHTLSRQTRDVLATLEDRLMLTALVAPDEELEQLGILDQLRALLDEYAAANPKARFEVIDAALTPDKSRLFAKRLGGDVPPNSVVAEYRGRWRLVTIDEMLLYSAPGAADSPSQPRFRGEEPFTRAIIGVVEESPAVVYFTQGHGEVGVESPNDPSKQLLAFAKLLRGQNCVVKTLELSETAARIPNECDALVIASPTEPFSPAAAEAVKQHLKRSGGLLLLFKPQFINGKLGELRQALEQYRLNPRDDVIVERFELRGAGYDMSSVFTGGNYADHEITRDLKALGTIFNLSGAITVLPETAGAQSRCRVTPLLTAQEGYWAETAFHDRVKGNRLDADDIRDPIIGAAVDCPGGPRIVVFSDSEFAGDLLFGQCAGNKSLATNAVSWIARKQAHIGGLPRDPDQRPIRVSAQNQRLTALIAWLAMPLFVIIVGAAIWWRRRQA